MACDQKLFSPPGLRPAAWVGGRGLLAACTPPRLTRCAQHPNGHRHGHSQRQHHGCSRRWQQRRPHDGGQDPRAACALPRRTSSGRGHGGRRHGRNRRRHCGCDQGLPAACAPPRRRGAGGGGRRGGWTGRIQRPRAQQDRARARHRLVPEAWHLHIPAAFSGGAAVPRPQLTEPRAVQAAAMDRLSRPRSAASGGMAGTTAAWQPRTRPAAAADMTNRMVASHKHPPRSLVRPQALGRGMALAAPRSF